MEQRLAALYVMWQSPPQMTVFGSIFIRDKIKIKDLKDKDFCLCWTGMTITYGAMGTAAAGLLLALASRVVLKQLGASGSWNLNPNNAINSFLIIFF